MATAFPNLPHWLCRKGKAIAATPPPPPPPPPKPSQLEPPLSGFRSLPSLTLPSSSSSSPSAVPSSRLPRSHGCGREACMDEELDAVIIGTSDGSGSGDEEVQSDDSDWSVGWFEPEEDSDHSFAVLVRCYGYGSPFVDESVGLRGDFQRRKDSRREGKTQHIQVTAFANLPEHDGKQYMEQWLSSLKG